MWTVIFWDRAANHWTDMRGYSDEDVATENAKQIAEELPPSHIVSLANNEGEIVWAEIGSHPAIGYCRESFGCWCETTSPTQDHTLVEGSSNT